MTIVQHPSPNVVPGRSGEAPDAVVLHTTDGTAPGTIHWFSVTESSVSAHYLVALDGTITQFADEGDTARHAGRLARPSWPLLRPDVSPNLHTIGIEFEDGGSPFDVERTEAQYRVGAELLAHVATRWGIAIDELHVIRHNEINGRKSCPAGLDVVRLRSKAREIADTWTVPARPDRRRDRPRLLCLMPARNAAADLPDALDSLWPACDAVLALDDGSTDDTLEVLSTHPLVEHVLRNPPRPGWAGWHDGANRNRLLRAAADLEPDWVVFIDADERLAAADAAELRRLVDSAPDPTVAYGFRSVRMWGSAFCEPTYRWVYRLFAHRRGLALPTRRLHFDPVPVTIPRAGWIRTGVRLQHLGASTAERIEQRRGKYDDADPGGSYASSMTLDGEPRDLVPWREAAGSVAG